LYRFLFAGVLSTLVLWLAVPALGDGEYADPMGSQTVTQETVSAAAVAPRTRVSSRVVRPRRVLRLRSRFTPTARPSVAQVFWIARLEAERYGVSAAGLLNRIRCESTYRWYESYTGHLGLLQFLPETWARGVSSMGSRRVSYVKKRTRRKAVFRVSRWSDGSRDRVRTGIVSQRVVHQFIGALPRNPSIWHGWAQIRVGAQAMAGRSAVSSSEWACGA
jgi:hypothetical protein